jgi:hypothetical protein
MKFAMKLSLAVTGPTLGFIFALAIQTHPATPATATRSGFMLAQAMVPPTCRHAAKRVRFGAELAECRRLAAPRRLQHFLGRASITNTVRYTAMSPEPFKNIWR